MSNNENTQMWRDYHEACARKRKNNKEWSTEFLRASGFSFESKNGGFHLVVTEGDVVADFWPSTGKFNIRGTKRYGRGVYRLVNKLRSQKEKQEQP